MPQIYDVAVIGCGPVGAALANLLETHGLTVLVLDQFVDSYPLPRATHIDGEAVRILQSAGVMDDLADKLGIYSRMRFEDADGKLLIDWPRSTTPGSHGWRDSNRFHQPDLEAALRERAANRPTIDLRLGWGVTAITQNNESVTLETTGPEGQAKAFQARYVVGCDGARSSTREALGAQLQTLAPSEQWLVADLILHPDTPDLAEGTVQYCDPARPVTYIEAVGRRRRWEVMLLPGDDPQTFAAPDHVYRLLSRWVTPQDAQIERSVVYKFNSTLASKWRKGRVLIAGDAAHQTPPFLGQGLCAGLRDAANLSWKLAWVLDGRATPALLDTFETELSPHVAQYIAEANRIGAIIQETDPDRAQARDADLLSKPQILAPLRPRLGGVTSPTGDELAGTLSPQPRLADGRLLDEAVGPRFAILARSGVVGQIGTETLDRWTKADARLIEDEALDYLDAIEAEAIIIRPDHYVFGVAKSAAEVETLTAALPLADG
ncbi:monooxygenase FAD-binding protein [Novosphingobium sp. Rr 2-17]|uniref:bifunctional 3-(3-hydroxy-phenyl)propionate/3-hydroxycinnamic acid hydroxylase MhpA n=1 Tax=Novosphingobium sp. Rr 2-17 TaxID=555793 RepID=UPI0002697BA0|nr:bifunctional 3-(3-hydroxy-phenyl)propionate/3-hydroxycinnamic acid hydroxylase [Novosphingobium sp. Rr 2-17]EIZ78332.1 monooxygenase FAD-binding protein [Novosphingobium sp. Rr 2-17]